MQEQERPKNKVGNTYENRLRAAERRIRSFELKKAGASYRSISRELGISISQAHKDVMNVLKDLAEQAKDIAKIYRELQSARLDQIFLFLWSKMGNNNKVAKEVDGKVVEVEEVPFEHKIQAINSMLRVMDRRAKLYGLDAPAKTHVTGEIGSPLGNALSDVIRQTIIADPESRNNALRLVESAISNQKALEERKIG